MLRSSGVSSLISCRAAALGNSSSSAVRSSGDISLRMPTTCSCAIARKQFLLRLDLEVFENVGREIMRQDAEDDDLFLLRQIEDDFRDIRRRPFRKQLAQRGEISRVDQASNFRLENFPDHNRCAAAAELCNTRTSRSAMHRERHAASSVQALAPRKRTARRVSPQAFDWRHNCMLKARAAPL